MNSNLFQTILTALVTISGIATSILISLGCHDVAGAVNCVGSTAPAWMIPYLAIATSILGIIKLITAVFTGKLTAPTAVVSNSGALGTVAPRNVAQ